MPGAELNLILSESDFFELFGLMALMLLTGVGGLAKKWRDRKAGKAGEQLVQDIELIEVAEIAPPSPPPIARPAHPPPVRWKAPEPVSNVPVKIATKAAATARVTTPTIEDRSWEPAKGGTRLDLRFSGSELRWAIVMVEILGPPVALRNDASGRFTH